MEERARVICHMMTTIDGKIVIDFDGNEDYDYAGEEYDRLIPVYGQAMGCGRATCQSGLQVDLRQYNGIPVKYEDKVIPLREGTALSVAFDRYGKLRWPSAIVENESGQKSMILEAVTEKVPPEFLAYLDDLNIPYLFAGKEDFDPALFLIKLKKLYHVDTFVLCGGAQINAEFMKRGLVDEISIVIGPAVDGARDALTCFGTDERTGFPQFYRLKEARQFGHNGVVLRYEKGI